MAGWSDVETMNSRTKRPRLEEEVDVFEFPDGEWVQLRLIGPINSYAWGWIEARNPKDKTKYNKFPKYSLDYDAATGKMIRSIDPYRRGGVYFSQKFLSNAIIRDLQVTPKKERPHTAYESKRRSVMGEKLYIKEKGSKSYTPVRVIDVPATVREKISSATDLYNRRFKKKKLDGKPFPRVELNDPKYGVDVLIKFNSKKSGADKWEVAKDEESSPLKKSELKYLMYDIEHLESIKPETKKEAEREWESLKDRIIFKDKDGKIIKKGSTDDDDDDDDVEDRKAKKKNSKEDDVPWDTDDEKPKKKKARKDDETPRKKKNVSKSKLKAKKKKANKFDDLEDLDD